MNIVTGKTGTPHVTSADARALNAGIFGLGNYVLATGSKFAFNIDSSNQITLSDGDLVINGCHARIPYSSSESLSIETGTVGYNRVDLIVAEYTLESGKEAVALKVIKGTPSTGTATTPSYVQGNILENDTTVDMPLYSVNLSGVNITSVIPLFTLLTGLDDVYRKKEVYNKSEVYNKNEVYPRAAVYLKEDVYNKGETYHKSEVYTKSETCARAEVVEIATNIATEKAQYYSLEVAKNLEKLIQNLDKRVSALEGRIGL